MLLQPLLPPDGTPVCYFVVPNTELSLIYVEDELLNFLSVSDGTGKGDEGREGRR